MTIRTEKQLNVCVCGSKYIRPESCTSLDAARLSFDCDHKKRSECFTPERRGFRTSPPMHFFFCMRTSVLGPERSLVSPHPCCCARCCRARIRKRNGNCRCSPATMYDNYHRRQQAEPIGGGESSVAISSLAAYPESCVALLFFSAVLPPPAASRVLSVPALIHFSPTRRVS